MSSCVFCRTGQLTNKLERMTLRQWSNKGYVRYEVMVVVHVCDSCGMRTLDETAQKIMDEAFNREYRKLPWVEAPANQSATPVSSRAVRSTAELLDLAPP